MKYKPYFGSSEECLLTNAGYSLIKRNATRVKMKNMRCMFCKTCMHTNSLVLNLTYYYFHYNGMQISTPLEVNHTAVLSGKITVFREFLSILFSFLGTREPGCFGMLITCFGVTADNWPLLHRAVKSYREGGGEAAN